MSGDRNFQQIWDFRRRNDDIDSSSDDSKSSCKDEPIHKLASALITAGNDESSDDPGYQKNDQVEAGKGVKSTKSRTKERLPRKTSGVKSKTKKGSRKEAGKRKRKSNAMNTNLLDDFKMFTESIIEDLKVKREKMFAQMKEDMKKVVPVKSTVKQTRKVKGRCRQKTGQARNMESTESDMKVRDCSGGTMERSIVSSKIIDSNNCSKGLERVHYDQTVQTIGSNKKEKGEHTKMSAKQSMYASNRSDQIVSSSYLALPSAPSEKQFEPQNIESPSRNCIKSGVAGNGIGTGVTFDRGNLVINAMNNCGYFSGTQTEVPFASVAQTGSNNISFYDQHRTQSLSMGNGYPLHQRLENSFNIQSQVENLARVNNIMGWRTNGGTMRFSGNGHTFADNAAANNFCNRLNYMTNEEVSRYGMKDPRDDYVQTVRFDDCSSQECRPFYTGTAA